MFNTLRKTVLTFANNFEASSCNRVAFIPTSEKWLPPGVEVKLSTSFSGSKPRFCSKSKIKK